MRVNSDNTAESDSSLLKRVVQGDSRAFEELYERWSSIMYGLTLKILEDAKEAEEALQDGFLHVWNHAGTYDETRSSPTTWAYMIFRNKAIDRIRVRVRRARGLERLAAEGNPPGTPAECAHETGAEANEARQTVRRAMEGIPEEQREAIRLAFFSGLTQMEIADKLGAPLGTIKARIRRGLLKLGESLKGKL